MIELILAMTKNGGIGIQNSLPWKCPEELGMFRSKTMDSNIIVGRKTHETLPRLLGRNVYILNNKTTLEEVIQKIIKDNDKKIFVIGGASIYKYVLENFSHIINKIHVSVMKDDYHCDAFVSIDIHNYITESRQEFNDFTHYVLLPKHKGETQYLSLLKHVFENGKDTYGRNGDVRSNFVNHLSFDLTKGFPLLTTKKMFFRGIVEELLFFIKGETNTKKLENMGINIWKGNTNSEFLEKMGLDYPEGEMGPMYGFQWRHFNGDYKPRPIWGFQWRYADGDFEKRGGVDQLMNVIDMIKTQPKSRRILMTDFNPLQVNEGVLYPCHSIILQFFVEDGFLDMYCFNRSSDLVLGLPFNIASSSLLLAIVAKITNLVPRFFNLSLGDSHIYKEHIDAVKEQLQRVPFKFPTIEIKDFEVIENLTYEHMILKNYVSHKPISAKMIA